MKLLKLVYKTVVILCTSLYTVVSRDKGAGFARRHFCMKSSCQIVFDDLFVGESMAAPLLPSRLWRAVWLWHFTLAQQSRPVTVHRLHSQLLPCTLVV